MSISGAVKELNQEIERITKIRDMLLQGTPGQATADSLSVAPVSEPAKKRAYTRRAVPAKAIPAKKAIAAKKAIPAVKKRTMSPEVRKRISDAHKKRAVEAKKASAAAA